MSDNPAYKQLLTLIGARSQQWLRNRIELLPQAPQPDPQPLDELAQIAIAAHICTGLRGSTAPLETFLQGRFTSDFLAVFATCFHQAQPTGNWRGVALLRIFPPDGPPCADPLPSLSSSSSLSLPDRLALSDRFDAAVMAEAEALLRTPVPEERLTEQVIDTYARVLALCYRFGAERPRFANVRAYGDAFANCLRFADWAQRKRRLIPLAQMCFCLCLIDPDHDVTSMLADVMSSQRPDGSFPASIGFGTADQGEQALAPTLAALVAVQMAVHRRWRRSQPILTLAA